MKTFFDWYKNVSGGDEAPKGNINGAWFSERGLPMIVECECCGATMALPSAYIDEDDYTFCSACADMDD